MGIFDDFELLSEISCFVGKSKNPSNQNSSFWNLFFFFLKYRVSKAKAKLQATKILLSEIYSSSFWNIVFRRQKQKSKHPKFFLLKSILLLSEISCFEDKSKNRSIQNFFSKPYSYSLANTSVSVANTGSSSYYCRIVMACCCVATVISRAPIFLSCMTFIN